MQALIIDATGVLTIDSDAARELFPTAETCRLVGARVVICGLSTQVWSALADAQAVDLTNITVVGDLQAAIGLTYQAADV